MQTFIFTNRNTHAAFEYLQHNSERLKEVTQCLESTPQVATECLQQTIEEWIVDERPTDFGSFYDQLLEQTLLDLDFENLADAIQQLGHESGSSKRTTATMLEEF